MLELRVPGFCTATVAISDREYVLSRDRGAIEMAALERALGVLWSEPADVPLVESFLISPACRR